MSYTYNEILIVQDIKSHLDYTYSCSKKTDRIVGATGLFNCINTNLGILLYDSIHNDKSIRWVKLAISFYNKTTAFKNEYLKGEYNDVDAIYLDEFYKELMKTRQFLINYFKSTKIEDPEILTMTSYISLLDNLKNEFYDHKIKLRNRLVDYTLYFDDDYDTDYSSDSNYSSNEVTECESD